MSFNLKQALSGIESQIQQLNTQGYPPELYDPLHYIMQLGGKRMRPTLVLLGYYAFKSDWEEILAPAVAVEMFHNFTLMHDDIMDNAPLRRGQPAVHEKWNTNTALLAGDVMLVKTYEILLQHLPAQHLRIALQKFSQCAAEVCEGQQLDMNFERADTVSEEEYVNMIKLKTAVLLGFSLELGALLAGASPEQASLLYEFGINIGIGFQLKDDLLDVYADSSKFGKQVGGDIIANKKTFLLIYALEQAQGTLAENLKNWLSKTDFNTIEKVQAVTDIYNQLNVKEATELKIKRYFECGFHALASIGLEPAREQSIRSFTEDLMNREK